MKKFLLLGAAAMMTCAANAQSITPVWESNAATAGLVDNGVRQITGFGTKVYLNEVGTGLVTEWENGAATGNSWDVNAFLVEQGQTYETTDSETGEVKTNNFTMWHPIASDDAGNLFVGACYGPNVPTLGSKWVVIPADGSADMQVVDLEFPENAMQARMDCISRVVGDLTSDAYIPLSPNGCSNVIIMNLFADPEQGDKIVPYLDGSVVIPSALSPDTQTILATIADYDFFAEGPSAAEAAPYVFQRKRGVGSIYGWDAAVEGLNAMVNADGNAIGGDGCTETGFDVFTIGETSYYVIPCKDGVNTHGRSLSFQVRNLATGSVVAEYKSITDKDDANGTFIARVNEDGATATIYAASQQNGVGVYTFDPNGEPAQSGIESTIANDNAPVEYYNLQGVKVANPENGIFVKKQAGKATKVVL